MLRELHFLRAFFVRRLNGWAMVGASSLIIALSTSAQADQHAPSSAAIDFGRVPTSRAVRLAIVTEKQPRSSQQVALDQAPEETAIRAEDFVNTIGFNAHIENKYSIYSTQFSRVKALLLEAGIRHVRVGMVFKNPIFYSQMQDLAQSGIYGLYVTLGNYTKEQIVGYPALVGSSLEGFEAPNEPDHSSDPDWATETRNFQKNLYTWVKGDPRTSRFFVVGPSVTGKFSELGDVSSYMDYGNTHNYLDVFNPDTSGFGGKTPFGTYGSIDYNVNILKITSGTKPVISTETGYGATPDGAMTSSNRPTLDYRTQLRYIPRLFLEQYRHGIARTYCYEFIDHGGQNTFDHFGVVQTDLTPKPAYYALKSLISKLSDRGESFTPQPLSMQLGGNTVNVQHMVMQKRSGQYLIPIWLEVRSWEPHGGGDLSAPDQHITLRTARHFTSARIDIMDEKGSYVTTPLSVNDGQISFPVSDKVSLVTLTP